MPDIGVNFPEHIVEITPSVGVTTNDVELQSLTSDDVPRTLSGIRRVEEREYAVIIALINNNKAIPNRTFLAAANEVVKEFENLKKHQRKIAIYRFIGSFLSFICCMVIISFISITSGVGVIISIFILCFVIPIVLYLSIFIGLIVYAIMVALGLERPFPFEIKNLINSYYFSGFNIKNKENEDSTSLLNTDNCIKITKFQQKNVKYMYEKKYNNKIKEISKHLPFNFINNIDYEDVTYVYHEDDYYLVTGIFKNNQIQNVLSISEIRVL